MFSEYLVLKPDGLDFAPFPLVRERSRQILRQPESSSVLQTPADRSGGVFPGGLDFENRAALGKPKATLATSRRAEQESVQISGDRLRDADRPQIEQIGPIAGLAGDVEGAAGCQTQLIAMKRAKSATQLRDMDDRPPQEGPARIQEPRRPAHASRQPAAGSLEGSAIRQSRD